MVEVVVSRLGLDSGSNSFVVILQEKDGDRILPIWIGRAEAESIAAHLDGVHRERPMTHDLCRSLIMSLDGVLTRVNVTRVHEGTFYAEMLVTRAGETRVIDARPSDGIAIAVRFGAPIFAAEELLAEYEGPSEAQEGEPEGEAESEADRASGLSSSTLEAHLRSAEQLKRHLERLRPEDFGKFSL